MQGDKISLLAMSGIRLGRRLEGVHVNLDSQAGTIRRTYAAFSDPEVIS